MFRQSAGAKTPAGLFLVGQISVYNLRYSFEVLDETVKIPEVKDFKIEVK